MKRASLLIVCSAALIAADATMSSAAETEPPPTTSVTGPVEQPGEPLELGLAELVLLAPGATGAGDRPAFSWEPIDGAATYSLAVLTAGDEPIWAWEGTATEVILGGWTAPPSPEAFGPLLQGEARWFVVAYDADGVPIANSVLRPVSP